MEYTKLFETVYKESIRLQETTVKADLNLLDAQLETDTRLKALLDTPAKDLPENYRYLVDEIYEDEADKTLYRKSARKIPPFRVVYELLSNFS